MPIFACRMLSSTSGIDAILPSHIFVCIHRCMYRYYVCVILWHWHTASWIRICSESAKRKTEFLLIFIWVCVLEFASTNTNASSIWDLQECCTFNLRDSITKGFIFHIVFVYKLEKCLPRQSVQISHAFRATIKLRQVDLHILDSNQIGFQIRKGKNTW